MTVILQAMLELFNRLNDPNDSDTNVIWKQLGNRHIALIPFQGLPAGFIFKPTSKTKAGEETQSVSDQEFSRGHYELTILAPPLSMMKKLGSGIDLQSPNAKGMSGAEVSFSAILGNDQQQAAIYGDLNLPQRALLSSITFLAKALEAKLKKLQPAAIIYNASGSDKRRKDMYDYIGRKQETGYIRLPDDVFGLGDASSVWLDKNQMKDIPATGKLADWMAKSQSK